MLSCLYEEWPPSVWLENMLGYMSPDITCSDKDSTRERRVFWERSSKKTVSFEEQMMAKDKNPSIFSCQMRALVFATNPSDIFRNTRSFENW